MNAYSAIAISHVALKVRNLQQSTDFYTDVVGLQPIPEPFQIGMHSWFALGAHCQLHLIAGVNAIPSFHIDHHLAMSTRLFDDFLKRLQAHGISYYDPFKNQGMVHVRPDGVRQVFFQDPDGYWLEMNDEHLITNSTI